jgi:hypothetical protein
MAVLPTLVCFIPVTGVSLPLLLLLLLLLVAGLFS